MKKISVQRFDNQIVLAHERKGKCLSSIRLYWESYKIFTLLIHSIFSFIPPTRLWETNTALVYPKSTTCTTKNIDLNDQFGSYLLPMAWNGYLAHYIVECYSALSHNSKPLGSQLSVFHVGHMLRNNFLWKRNWSIQTT